MCLQMSSWCSLLALLTLTVAICSGASVPLPGICLQTRADRNQSLNIPLNASDCGRVRRAFYHPAKSCKIFSLCSSASDYLDTYTPGIINYFQDKQECLEFCTGVVECPLEPLQELENGSANLPAGKLGYKVSVSFQCVQGYRLAENTPRTCQLNGTWSGRQPHCEIQCPLPSSAQNSTLSPLQQYYNIGQRVHFDCMDGLVGNTTWTCLEDGSWRGSPPSCSPACIAEVIDNAYPPEISHDTATIAYKCLEGYHSIGNLTMPCNGGVLAGRPPICTKAKIVTKLSRRDISSNGTYNMYHKVDLECVLDGVDSHNYPVSWKLPKKPNGEHPPKVTISGGSIEFSSILREQSGKYTCNIAGIEASVIIEVIVGAADPPKVTYMDPTGVVKISRGNQERLTCLTVGSLPLSVMWWHNGSVVHNNSLANISQYLIQNLTLNSGAYSTLIIDNVSEFVEGDYKCVGFNRAGKAQSNPGVQLMLAAQRQSIGGKRRRRESYCASATDHRQVVLVARMSRTHRPEGSILSIQTIRVKVIRVLRGETSGMPLRSLEVVVSPGVDISRFTPRQKLVLSGVPNEDKLFTLGEASITEHSLSLERAILEC